jgi:hypothetical protein
MAWGGNVEGAIRRTSNGPTSIGSDSAHKRPIASRARATHATRSRPRPLKTLASPTSLPPLSGAALSNTARVPRLSSQPSLSLLANPQEN